MPSEERFAVLKNELERNGWVIARTKGSHHIFEKRGFKNIVVPVHGGKVKPFYVKQIRKILQGDQPSI
jgi:predicted RNA binding protein YcfA (HicA-like mRNA interferase family)